MKIKLSTTVAGTVVSVFKQFDRKLFEVLKPPFINLQIERYDGGEVGHRYDLKLGLFGINQKWQGVVTAREESGESAFFIDEGRILPRPLIYWRHKHLIEKKDERTVNIIDDIEFRCGLPILDFLMQLVLLNMFKRRQPLYRKYFGEPL